MRYLVVIEKEEASWGAHVPDLPVAAGAQSGEFSLKIVSMTFTPGQ